MELTVFFILAGLLAVQSLIALQDGARFLRFVRRRLRQPLPAFAPPTTVVCPCKGLDAELEVNLRAVLEQDYPTKPPVRYRIGRDRIRRKRRHHDARFRLVRMEERRIRPGRLTAEATAALGSCSLT